MSLISILTRLPKKAPINKPGTAWFNGISDFVENLAIRYGEMLCIERVGFDTTIVIPHPNKFIAALDIEDPPSPPSPPETGDKHREYGWEELYVIRLATSADVAENPDLVVGQPLMSKRFVLCSAETETVPMVPHTCPVVP